ncbi:hypothetical protein ACWDA9_41905 [Streptomyces sp. NPDC001193]
MSATTLLRRPGLARIRSTRAPLSALCLGFVALVVLVAGLAPWIAPCDPNAVDLGNALAGPSAEHLLGVDASGRDTLSRLVLGARLRIPCGSPASKGRRR